ncbi:hypothetical protein PSR1_03015 [Anaeromyxobacter sp. PSR-1]|nr:hypothetical protein PSR1_03015 [Anaeromyxobacter sp. PSR-1]
MRPAASAASTSSSGDRYTWVGRLWQSTQSISRQPASPADAFERKVARAPSGPVSSTVPIASRFSSAR